jgi:hypothetical protein
MSTIITRSGKGSLLTNTEIDDNFTNLNSDKVETSAIGTAAAKDTGTTNGTVPLIGAGNILPAAILPTSSLAGLTDVGSAAITNKYVLVADGSDYTGRLLVKADVSDFSEGDYATAAQGILAADALPKSGGTMTGAITTNSTFDGRDVAADGAILDAISTNYDPIGASVAMAIALGG